jgi:hypothetical protein
MDGGCILGLGLYQAAPVEAEDDGSLSSEWLLWDEDVCSDFMVSDFFVGGLDEVQAGEFGVRLD